MSRIPQFSVSWEEFIDNLIEENKKLKKEVEVWKNANKKLRMHDAKTEYENKKLKEENEDLKAIVDHYKKFEEWKNKLKEVYIKNTAKFLDKKFPKINWFMEEDTLQELRDLGKI